MRQHTNNESYLYEMIQDWHSAMFNNIIPGLVVEIDYPSFHQELAQSQTLSPRCRQQQLASLTLISGTGTAVEQKPTHGDFSVVNSHPECVEQFICLVFYEQSTHLQLSFTGCYL